MSNPNVMNMIPQVALNKEESDFQLKELIELERSSDTKIWSLCDKTSNEFIGFAGFLKIDGSNSPSANIDWGGNAVTNSAGISGPSSEALTFIFGNAILSSGSASIGVNSTGNEIDLTADKFFPLQLILIKDLQFYLNH